MSAFKNFVSFKLSRAVKYQLKDEVQHRLP